MPVSLSSVVVVLCCIALHPLRSECFQSAPRVNSPIRQQLTTGLESDIFDQKISPNRIRDVQVISPLLEYGYKPAVDEYLEYKEAISTGKQKKETSQKPLLLYLPGFDGTFLSPFIQFPELNTIFDVRCMYVKTRDRSTFDELRDFVINYLEKESSNTEAVRIITSTEAEIMAKNITNPAEVLWQKSVYGEVLNFFGSMVKGNTSKSEKEIEETRPVYLAGESFGGLLATEVALRLLDRNKEILDATGNARNRQQNIQTNKLINLKGLTLINSATCFDRSKFARKGPEVAQLPIWLYPAGLIKLLPLFADKYSFHQLIAILKGKALPSVIDNETKEAYMGRVAFSLPFVIPFMPRETLQWRLSAWLATGCERVASNGLRELGMRYPELRALVVAGEDDRCLPSIAEAERIASIIPDTMVHVVEGAGHASTCGSRVDLAALFRNRYPELVDDEQTKFLKHGSLFSGIIPTRTNMQSENDAKIKPRTEMKATARADTGILFGMEPRYDNKTIGLSPLKYWSEQYYRKLPSES